MPTAEEILQQLKDGVIRGDDDAVKKAASEAAAAGVDPYDAIMNGLAAGMTVVGDLYAKQEYYVPEVLVASEALYGGLDILQPLVVGTSKGTSKGVAVIGVVQGDVHDIGKNLVKMMLQVAGFEIHDLGRDVDLQRFVDTAIEVNADLVCMSTLMTTTMLGMKEIIPTLREKAGRAKILIGGAPLNEKIAEDWGAHGYGDNATEAVTIAERLVGVPA